jgi:hypothetical protein
MMFLAYLFFFLIYLGVAVALVRLAARAARSRGRKGWHWGLPVAVILYLVPFWDHIPTWVIHKYLCATEAGFWVYKTPEQWRAENPGVAEMLTWRERSPSFSNADVTSGMRLNERFTYERRVKKIPLVPVRVSTAVVVDSLNRKIMAKRVRVGSGYPLSHPKLWVGAKLCSPKSELWELVDRFKMQGSELK